MNDQQPDIEKLLKELEQMKDLSARSQADLQNAKARMEKESADSRRFAEQNLIHRLLPTIDNFQRAFDHLPEDLKDHEWVKGLQVVEQAFVTEMQSVGLQRIESLGETVDPDKHEVLQAGPGENGTVVEVLEDGYTLHDKVIRPAKVIVGDGS